MESRLTSAAVLFSSNNQCLKAVGCFREGALSWMFGKILNATMPNNLIRARRSSEENLPITGIIRENLGQIH